jgi:hypothetical protein
MRAPGLVILSIAIASACNFTLHDVVPPSEAGARDGGPSEAATDAPVSGDAAAPEHFCARNPGHDFCDDFDDGYFGLGWAPFEDDPTRIGSTTSDKYVSPPYAAHFKVTGMLDGATDNFSSRFVRLAGTGLSELHLAFDMNVEPLEVNKDFVMLYFGTGGLTDPNLRLIVAGAGGTGGNDTTMTVAQENAGDAQDLAWPTSPVAGDWYHVAIDVQIGPPTHVMMSLAKGSGSATKVVDSDMGAPWAKGPGSFNIGVPFTGILAGIYLDNITLDGK